jgi:uncharacterized membrane protein (DUF485 family)
MLGRFKTWFAVVLAAAVAAYFANKGEKLTQFFAGSTAFLGAFSVNEWGIIIGIFLGVASFILSWIYKQKYLEAVRDRGSSELMDE